MRKKIGVIGTRRHQIITDGDEDRGIFIYFIEYNIGNACKTSSAVYLRIHEQTSSSSLVCHGDLSTGKFCDSGD